MKAFLLSAGLGTRLKPITDHCPKALVEIDGKSLLERNILHLQKSGIREVVVNVHHFAEKIIETIRANQGFGSTVTISDESEAVLETGGGLKKAAVLLKDKEPVLMLNVDILCNFNLQKMLTFHQKKKALATLAVQNRNSSRMLLFDEADQLCGWQNIKTGEAKLLTGRAVEDLHPFAFSGIQLLSQEFLGKIKQEGKFSIIETYLDLGKTEKIIGWNHTGDLWIDVGKPESLEMARKQYSLFE